MVKSGGERDPMYAELFACSNFSFLRGASHPEEMVDAAHALGLTALALCDRHGLYGMVRAWVRAKELGLKLIVGVELEVQWNGHSRTEERPTIALLVQDAQGYRNLCQLLTLAHRDAPKGEALLQLDGLGYCDFTGLTALVPADSLLLATSRDDSGIASTDQNDWITRLQQIFFERIYLLAYRHRDAGEAAREQSLLEYQRRRGLKVVASARPRMHVPERKALADVLECIRRGTTLQEAGTRLMANCEARLLSEAQMRARFKDHPDWLDQTAAIVEQIRFDLGSLQYHFPCSLASGETADQKLERLTWQGADRRYPDGVPSAVRTQLERELALIAQMGMASYFLSTWEIVEIARERRILCQGRGSAANSAVCFVLGITAVDPARSDLLFERFMSPERYEPPDIDVDFEHERREEVIQAIYQRYGRDHAAMVSEVICYRGKSALREVGKAWGLSLDQVDRLSMTITGWDAPDGVEAHLADVGLDQASHELQQVVQLAREMQGFPRHLSIHVGGFVLSARHLNEVSPIEPARMPGRTVIPWDKDDIDALGFFKVDVLGLGMLTAIRKALALSFADGKLRRSKDEVFDPIEVLARIPAEDPEVYRMISRADTVGVFQIESRAQMVMLPRLRPRRFYDLVIEVAIVRPGPIQGKMVHPYLRRRNREEAVEYPHAELRPVLERTLGVPLFQEQVMQIAIVGANYNPGDADQLRRDMAAWKRHGRLLQHRDRLLAGFRKKGIPEEFGHALFEQIKGFAEYGFPESHAASFALLVYSSAWLKYVMPAHFSCALLNSQPMGFYSPHSLVRDVQHHGVTVRDVDVSHSNWQSTLEWSQTGPANGETKRALRLGLHQVIGLGETAGRAIEEAREQAPFADVHDLIQRTHLDGGKVEVLAQAGALESLIEGRRNALWAVRRPRPEGLFETSQVDESAPRLPHLGAVDTLRFDYATKQLSVDDHPLKHLRTWLKQRKVQAISGLVSLRHHQKAAVAGLVLCRQKPYTASGMLFMTIEDETGVANLVVEPKVQERYGLLLRQAGIIVAWGRLERSATKDRDEVPVLHVKVDAIERLDRMPRALRAMSRDFH
jgi:error-prone DNA polymerase